ncbi:Ig-like domain-containing protein [Propionibacteriaceae bacterium Y2011]|uniref:L,D-transpeptidase n=1 Tax=Microlunatus sp. Y2014 TaxID=3418488 RepID=UPI003B4525C6
MARTGTTRTVLALLLGTVVFVAGCGTNPNQPAPQQDPAPATSAPQSQAPAPEPTPTPSPTSSPVTLTSNVDDGAEGVTVDTLLNIKAAHGTLEAVTASTVVQTKSGKEKLTVPGGLNDDRTEWRATDGLEPGTTYAINIDTVAADGTRSSISRTFQTQDLTLDQQTFPSIYPLDGQTVGVGMPVIIRFDIPVTDRANVEKHLHITTTPAQAGSWYWPNDSEVHYRPATYWIAGTKVEVDARLNGVKAGADLYGQTTRSWSFQVGRKVVAEVDLAKHVMRVFVNDKLSRTIQVSAGKAGFTTRNGTKVISEKLRHTPMRSETEDINDPEYYDLDDVEFAMRLTNSGEFFHAAPWNSRHFGKNNASHGCVGMSMADAEWLFNTMAVGDVATFNGSNRGMEPLNGYTDWNLSWPEVKSKSALG